jgi:hypothetical protein
MPQLDIHIYLTITNFIFFTFILSIILLNNIILPSIVGEKKLYVKYCIQDARYLINSILYKDALQNTIKLF